MQQGTKELLILSVQNEKPIRFPRQIMHKIKRWGCFSIGLGGDWGAAGQLTYPQHSLNGQD